MIRRVIGVAIVLTLLVDRYAGRFLLPEEFAQWSTSDIRASMHQRGLWRPRGPEDLPPPRRGDEVVVGIFGGSLATALATSLQTRVPTAAVDLANAFGKHIRIVDLAMGGGRQPMQFNTLHIFRDAVDVAVFVDGFNEMMEKGEACDGMLPFWAANRDKSALQLLQPLIELNERIDALADSSIWDYASGSWLWRMYISRVNNRSYDQTSEFARSMGVPFALRMSPFATPSELATTWARCVTLSAEYAASLGLPIYFFLQPNQYVAGSKPFSEEEKRHAFRHPGKVQAILTKLAHRVLGPNWAVQDLTPIYSVFEDQIEQLRLRGLNAHSLGSVYGDVTETVYRDDCCHVNERGNEIMAQAIFLKLLERNRSSGADSSAPGHREAAP